MEDLKKYVREVPDFPKPGIQFYDITTLLKHPVAFRKTVDLLTWPYVDLPVDKVVGMESRGFIFAPILASRLNAGFVPVRKAGKLPGETLERSYSLEYGEGRLQMHVGAVEKGEQVLIIDDLIATGGTARATVELVEAAGGEVAGIGFVIELQALGGRDLLRGHEVTSLIVY